MEQRDAEQRGGEKNEIDRNAEHVHEIFSEKLCGDSSIVPPQSLPQRSNERFG